VNRCAAVQNKILDDFRQKYLENRVMSVGPSRAKFDSGDRVAIKIAPVRDLPDGFSSNPGTPPPRSRDERTLNRPLATEAWSDIRKKPRHH
jgi:hypothetical protein